MQAQAKKKAKLRTAADVISFLRWNADHEFGSVSIGYDDRINGPMEKPAEDYVPICDGGDIPEHRISYFRAASSLTDEIIWDRRGRVDRVFGSGAGPDPALVSPETYEAARAAAETMDRLEAEREERREIRAGERARRAAARRRRAAAAGGGPASAAGGPATGPDDRAGAGGGGGCGWDRFSWAPAPWYEFSHGAGDWEERRGGRTEPDRSSGGSPGRGARPRRRDPQIADALTVVTWNVLFDRFDREGVERSAGDGDVGVDPHEARWGRLSEQLGGSGADVIALQEATPVFVCVLLSSPWVRADFASSASPSESGSVDPCGVLLLWRRSRLAPVSPRLGLSLCGDLGRNRSIVASLVRLDEEEEPDGGGRSSGEGRSIVMVVNVHLPADRLVPVGEGSGESTTARRESRTVARRRELGAVIGQLQWMEGALRKIYGASNCLLPLVAGVFNSDEPNIFVGESLSDVWPLVGVGPGKTFDPTKNARAARSGTLTDSGGEAKRFDRIFVGRRELPSRRGSERGDGGSVLVPSAARMMGADGNDVPPSDHYGLCAVLRPPKGEEDPRSAGESAVFGGGGYDAWAANATPSPDFLLAIPLHDRVMQSLKDEYDHLSSLSLPHITLLHGFVEVCASNQALVKDAVEAAIAEASLRTPPPVSLTFPARSPDVFEHRSSSALVVRPDEGDGGGGEWLGGLYGALRDRFRPCGGQERRSAAAGGWAPHALLGRFGSAAAARAVASGWADGDGGWAECVVPIRAVDVFRRGGDGNFHTIASYPIMVYPRKSRVLSNFIGGGDASLSAYSKECALSVVAAVERSCRSCARSFGNFEVSVTLTGSMAMDAALPMLSDCDAVVVLRPSAIQDDVSPIDGNEYFDAVASDLRKGYPRAKVRMRTARASGGKLPILTAKLLPNFPAVDLLLCACDSEGNPLDHRSWSALLAVRDSESIVRCIQRAAAEKGHDPAFACDLFKSVLRFAKYWAHSNDIYGAEIGYLGGGGWAVFVARIFTDMVRSGALCLDGHEADADIVRTSAIRHFFIAAARWPWPKPVRLHVTEEVHASPAKNFVKTADMAAENIIHRETMSVLAPYSNGHMANLARNSTRSSTSMTAEKIQNAALHLSAAASGSQDETFQALESIIKCQSAHDFISCFPSILVVEVSYDPGHQGPDPHPAQIKAWGSSQVLRLVVILERALGVCVCPRRAPLRLGRGWDLVAPGAGEGGAAVAARGSPPPAAGFVWIVGARCAADDALGAIGGLGSALDAEIGAAFPGCSLSCSLRVLDSELARTHIPNGNQSPDIH